MINYVISYQLDKVIHFWGTLSVKFGIYVCQMTIFKGVIK
jgi:hypothetical protein